MIKAFIIAAAAAAAFVTAAVTYTTSAPAQDAGAAVPIPAQWVIYATIPHRDGKVTNHPYQSDNQNVDTFASKEICEQVLASPKLELARQGLLLAVYANEGPVVAGLVTFTCELGGNKI